MIKNISPLGIPWSAPDPFLMCTFHEDKYPRGNGIGGPDSSLEGRSLGQDFSFLDGWNMYHGQTLPGFPVHPHKGFETITIVNKGWVDHADSLGGSGRYSAGDVQWMTAGRGVQHSEMFPLLNIDGSNPLELFQIWLNLPSRSKSVEPYYRMLWSESVPTLEESGAYVRVIAGRLDGLSAQVPAPNSYAAKETSELSILTIDLAPGSAYKLPACSNGVSRTLYYYRGSELVAARQKIGAHCAIETSCEAIELSAGSNPVQLLVLQGRPISEPVKQYGPFVMNTDAQLREAMQEYRDEKFGQWSWESAEPFHGSEKRFARFFNGQIEVPNTID